MDHSDIVCNDDVGCGDLHEPDYEFCMYLAQFINWFVNRTFRDIHLYLGHRKKKLFKIQVFKLYSNDKDGFLKLIDNFNRYMGNNATTIFPDISIYDMDLYPDPPDLLDRPTADFYTISGEQVNTKIINLVIAAHIIHKILSLSDLVIGIIRVSQLQTYMELLPSEDDEQLNDAYLETLQLNPNDTTIRLLQIPTPLQAEIILHAENFEYYKGSRGRHSILEVRYPGLSIEDVRLPILPPQAPPPPLSFPPPVVGSGSHERSVAAAAAWAAANRAHAAAQAAPPSGGAKKRNKSKRRNQKKSNKKSRRHRNRKRLSRRNAKRFY